MISVIHGKKVMNCQWTAEPILEKFMIPERGLKRWIGCYGSPSVCVAAIMSINDFCSPEVIHELIDNFESSLRRKKGMESVKFTINPAPSYKLLSFWGGKMSLEDYHAQYDHDEQIEIFTQELPELEHEERILQEKEARQRMNAPKQWNRTIIDGEGEKSYEGKEEMPRCVNGWFDFMTRRMNKTAPLTVYVNPMKRRVIGFGEGRSDKKNVEASRILGMDVMNDRITLIHRRAFPRKKEGAIVKKKVTKKAKKI